MAIIRGTLAKELDGAVEYVYPKTDAEMVEYDPSASVKDKIDKLNENIAEINDRITVVSQQYETLITLVSNIQKEVEAIKKSNNY